jgi:hypothetical protein
MITPLGPGSRALTLGALRLQPIVRLGVDLAPLPDHAAFPTAIEFMARSRVDLQRSDLVALEREGEL